MANLPLELRKNIKEAEVKRDEHLVKIEKATGRKFTVELDIPKFNEAATASDMNKKGNRVGTIYYDWLLGGVANNIAKLCADDMSKEAFNSIVTNPVIEFVLKEKVGGYGSPEFIDGKLYIVIDPSRASGANASQAGEDMVKKIPGLELKLNLKAAEPKRAEHLAAIEKATGRKFTLEIQDIPKFNEAATASDMNKKGNRVGTIFYDWVLGGVAKNLAKLCADEMSKEAFNEAVKNTVILFQLQDKIGGYGTAQIKDGQLIVAIDPTKASGANANDVGNNISKLL